MHTCVCLYASICQCKCLYLVGIFCMYVFFCLYIILLLALVVFFLNLVYSLFSSVDWMVVLLYSFFYFIFFITFCYSLLHSFKLIKHELTGNCCKKRKHKEEKKKVFNLKYIFSCILYSGVESNFIEMCVVRNTYVCNK